MASISPQQIQELERVSSHELITHCLICPPGSDPTEFAAMQVAFALISLSGLTESVMLEVINEGMRS